MIALKHSDTTSAVAANASQPGGRDYVELDGIAYKIGAHGFVFRWSSGEWVRAGKEPHEITDAMKKKQRGRKPAVRTGVKRPAGVRNRDLVLNCLRRNKEALTVAEVALLSGANVNSARVLLRDLADEGLIVPGQPRETDSRIHPRLQTWRIS